MGVLSDYKHSKSTHRVLARLVSVVCPRQVQEFQEENNVIAEIELALKALPHVPRNALLIGIRAFENAARFVPSHRGKPFSQLETKQAKTYFEAWQSSPLPIQSQFIKGLRGLICIAYFDLPSVQRHIGYTPEQWVNKSKEKRLKRFLKPILEHEASLFERDPLPLGRSPNDQKEGE